MGALKSLACCCLCLVVCFLPDFTVAQYLSSAFGAMRGGVMYPGYPGYPSPAIYPPADMYPSGVIYPGMDMYDPYLERGRPIIGGDLIHRPAVVSDRSDRTVEHINISNNNQNIREEVGSGNVVVNQVTSNNAMCNCQIGRFDQCPYPERCVSEGTCTGGSGICRNPGLFMI
ncbi:uncharacterized protein LOC132733972 [Ruditapes philippinarum]|uniref:uncharacterized protein LOC132733972 n=1 Tax=Ruditapes philippinarum TaxID=129788 RepID=UPI00295C39E1|nr:uncharacterized protein LOC132733972 [Ruditapes philippinarum]